MKRFNNVTFCLLSIALLSSCDNNTKLEQANAEKAIRYFVQSNSFDGSGNWGQQGSFNENSISEIRAVSQFSETEASCIFQFNYHDAYADGNLTLKFNFKRNIDKRWILTSIDEVSGVGSQGMRDRLRQWQNLDITAQ